MVDKGFNPRICEPELQIEFTKIKPQKWVGCKRFLSAPPANWCAPHLTFWLLFATILIEHR